MKPLKTTLTSGVNPSIVFFGSGPVAAASLKLLAGVFTVEAIITKPTTKNELSDVAPDIPVYSVSGGQELTTLLQQKQFSSSLGVLIDFGIIVSAQVINHFKHGIINSHFSLLPEWRGADPISYAILSGQQKTGVSLMLLAEKMDEGLLLGATEYQLTPAITTPVLTDALIQVSFELLIKIIPSYVSGAVSPTAQTVETAVSTYSRKLTKQDGVLNFTKPATVLEREIRAYQTWPKSRMQLFNKDVVILAAHVENTPSLKQPGEVIILSKKSLAVACKNSLLLIDQLKPSGKNAMSSQAFLAGYSQLD